MGENSVQAQFKSLTDNGEIIIGVIGLQDKPWLAKFKLDHTLVWAVSANCRLHAVGTSNIYTLTMCDKHNQSVRLIVRRLEDGATISELPIRGKFPLRRFTGTRLEAILTGDEKILVVKDNKNIYCLFEVSSGKAIPEIKTSNKSQPGEALEISILLQDSSSNSRVVVLEKDPKRYVLYDYTYQAEPAGYRVKFTRGPVARKPFTRRLVTGKPWTPCGFDLGNNLVFSRRWIGGNRQAIGFHVRGIGARTRKTRNVTLPSDQKRVDLILPSEESNEAWEPTATKQNHLGMVDGYLVYYDATQETLMVADFWPSW